MPDDSTLCVHTITTKPWSIEQDIDYYPRFGVGGVTVWREALQGRDTVQVGERIRDAGLQIVSLCRGGFFPSTDETRRQRAIEDNLRALDQAAELGAPLLVVVPGAVPDQPLQISRRQIRDGIAAVLPYAESLRVKLGIEPLHPMYADCRSAINTLQQANDVCEALDSPLVGVVVDVYHLWWDPSLQAEIARCGRSGRLFAFHISDWRTPTGDLLYDREIMGRGCIPLAEIRGWVQEAGFEGFQEVEILSHAYWVREQETYLREIVEAFQAYVGE